jgi:hypothetical protein
MRAGMGCSGSVYTMDAGVLESQVKHVTLQAAVLYDLATEHVALAPIYKPQHVLSAQHTGRSLGEGKTAMALEAPSAWQAHLMASFWLACLSLTTCSTGTVVGLQHQQQGVMSAFCFTMGCSTANPRSSSSSSSSI